jgi:hypothetical protein
MEVRAVDLKKAVIPKSFTTNAMIIIEAHPKKKTSEM